MNFALILAIGILVTGLVCVLDLIWFKKYRAAGQDRHWIIRESYSFFPILVIVLALRSFLVEPFRIPSPSLEPTLLVGDFVAVNKFVYGIRLPIIEKKIIKIGEPKRGDIVVFRWPPNPSYDFIKRVIGVPGDKVVYKDKQLFINGKAIPLAQTKLGFKPGDTNILEFIEDLNGIKHHIYQRKNIDAYDFEIAVPNGHYLVMGDNRDDSADSRYWGFVPEEFLRGKAFGIWMSLDTEHYRIRFNRIGQAIH